MSDTLIDFSGPSEKTPYICIHTEPAVIGTRRSDQSLCADCVFSLVEESRVRGGGRNIFHAGDAKVNNTQHALQGKCGHTGVRGEAAKASVW